MPECGGFAATVGALACDAMGMWPRLVAVLVAGVLSLVPGALVRGAAAGEDARVAFAIGDPRITESSGLAASVRHPGVLWTHNDSGDSARLFALGPDGRVLATVRLAGVEARDWEAIATGRDDAGRPALFVGDVGDNLGSQRSVSVYRVTEPAALRDATVPARRYRLRYADGPHNAEALLVDPRSNRLYVASKQDEGGGLYLAPARLRSEAVNVLRRIAAVPATVTDGAFAPDGRTFVLRTYLDAHVYTAQGRPLDAFGLPLQRQGESITYSRDGRDVLVGSEGLRSEIWRIRLPDRARPPAPQQTRAAPDGAAPGDAPSRPWRTAGLAATAVIAVAALLAGALLLRRRS
jgi:hypothetical protein